MIVPSGLMPSHGLNGGLFNNNVIPFPFLTFRKNRNLRSHLVRAKLNGIDCDENSPPPIKMEIKQASVYGVF